jgi:uncharacterized protein YjbJ (UPF0337 family)
MHHENEGWCNMAGKLEQSKGKAKQVVGAVSGSKKLESEGKNDRRAGEAKERLGRAKSKVEAMTEQAERRVTKAIDKAKDATRRK